MRWEDQRFIAIKEGNGESGSYNEHRYNNCLSNYVQYSDTLGLWKPILLVLEELEVVILNLNIKDLHK